MNYKIIKSIHLSQENIEIHCNPKDYETMKEIMKTLQYLDMQCSAYDDEHNMYFIPIMFIYYIENVDNKTYLYTKDESFRSYQTFTTLNKLFSPHGFRQINKNTLVNLYHVHASKIIKDCRRILFLDNEEQLIVNRKFKDSVKCT